MRTLLVATGGAVLAVGLAAGPVAGSAQPPRARPAAGSSHRVTPAANRDGHGAAAVVARDRSPAECAVVRVRPGQQVLRLQDPESGIRGFRGTPVANAVLTPSGKSLPRPVAQSDVRVSRPVGWFQGGVVISHVNGAGIEGSCFVTVAADGRLTSRGRP